MHKISANQSNLIWRLKGLAIFTVYFAHIPYSGSNEVINYIFNLLGMIGVPTFLILSGFFDYGRLFNLSIFIKKTFVPLLILGGGGYVMSHYNTTLSLGEFFIDLLKWLYGCESWLYFVPVLLWCKIITRPRIDVYQYMLIAASIVSITLTSCCTIPYNSYFTPYTNPFNFIIYFQVGRLIRKYDIEVQSNALLLIASITMAISILCWQGLPSYFSIFAIPVSLSAYIILYNVAAHLRFGEEIGKLSYVIYLIHLVPAGILNRYGLKFLGSWFDFVKVPVIFAIIFFVVWIGKYCLERLNLNKWSQYLGYR